MGAGQMPVGLTACVLVVGLPADWDTTSLRCQERACRAWSLELRDGLIPVWRSASLTVGQAVSLVHDHVISGANP